MFFLHMKITNFRLFYLEFLYDFIFVCKLYVWKQRGSVVRVGDLNAEVPGSNPRLGLLSGFVLDDPWGKLTTLCK